MTPTVSLDQNDLGIYSFYVFLGIISKLARGYKNTLLRPLAVKCSNKLLLFGPSNRSLPTFGLEVHQIQAKSIFLNDAVNPLRVALCRRFHIKASAWSIKT